MIHTHTHIYIYSHPQADCFVLSELFSVARHVGRSKLGSKPIQLYVRLSLRPLGQQAYHDTIVKMQHLYSLDLSLFYFLKLFSRVKFENMKDIKSLRGAFINVKLGISVLIAKGLFKRN